MAKKTIRCKLKGSESQADALMATLDKFAAACNEILAIANQTSIKDAYPLQAHCYRAIKEKYELTSNYVVRAIARVSASFGKKNLPKLFRPTSLDLDKNLIRYIEQREEISIS